MDRRFFKIMKEHQFLNDTSIYYAVLGKTSDPLYVVVIEDEKDISRATYSSFDSLSARQKYQAWYDILAKNNKGGLNEKDFS